MGSFKPIGMDSDKVYGVVFTDDYQIPSTYAPKGSRSEWIGKHAFKFPDGKWHLHARYLKGEVMWVLSGRASPICKMPGRCRIVEIKTV